VPFVTIKIKGKQIMKSSNLAHVAILMWLTIFVPIAGKAATFPLAAPYGLALDASGNLYVGNTAGNDVLVYNPSHVQTRRVTQGVQGPTGVAIDPSGNLWVANSSANSITEYGPAGKQITLPGTLMYGIDNPQAIAVDGLYDVWVENNFASVGVYPYMAARIISSTFGDVPVTGVAVYKDFFVVGGNTSYFTNFIPEFLLTGLFDADSPPGCFAVAYSAAGELYCGTLNNTVSVRLASGGFQELINLPFFPYGIAVDSTRGLIYVSDGVGNRILVYSTSGTLLHTIQ
jgi:DNA-binding beta-propeller fold protein YncE